jgi:hypothetical protein
VNKKSDTGSLHYRGRHVLQFLVHLASIPLKHLHEQPERRTKTLDVGGLLGTQQPDHAKERVAKDCITPMHRRSLEVERSCKHINRKCIALAKAGRIDRPTLGGWNEAATTHPFLQVAILKASPGMPPRDDSFVDWRQLEATHMHQQDILGDLAQIRLGEFVHVETLRGIAQGKLCTQVTMQDILHIGVQVLQLVLDLTTEIASNTTGKIRVEYTHTKHNTDNQTTKTKHQG